MTTEEIVLAEIRKNIKEMSMDDQIRIECIAGTLRGILKADSLSGMAFALVGAEAATV